MRKITMDEYTARCQFWLSVVFLFGYFAVILLFLLGYAKIPTDYKEAFSGLMSLLTGGGLTILYFWFQRARLTGSPLEPNTTVTTTSSATVTPREVLSLGENVNPPPSSGPRSTPPPPSSVNHATGGP